MLLAASLYFLYRQHNFPKLSNFPNGKARVDGKVFGVFGANGWTGMLIAVAGGLLLPEQQVAHGRAARRAGRVLDRLQQPRERVEVKRRRAAHGRSRSRTRPWGFSERWRSGPVAGPDVPRPLPGWIPRKDAL